MLQKHIGKITKYGFHSTCKELLKKKAFNVILIKPNFSVRLKKALHLKFDEKKA